LLQCNDATNPQQNQQQWPVVIPTAAATDCPAAMSDNLGASKMTNTTNVGPWQQGKGTRGYNNGGNDRPPSSPANGEDNNAAVGNKHGDATTAGNNNGDMDAGTSSVFLAMSNALATTMMLPTTVPMSMMQPGRRPW
jgi:hypothetical protein